MRTHRFEEGGGPRATAAFRHPAVLEAARAYRETKGSPRARHELKTALIAAGYPHRVTDAVLRSCSLTAVSGAENYLGTPGRGQP